MKRDCFPEGEVFTKPVGFFLTMLLMFTFLFTLTAFAADTSGEEVNTGQNSQLVSASADWRSYNGKRIGVLTGTLMEDVAKEYFPDSEYVYLDSYPDCSLALLSGKIDAFLADEPNLKTMHFEEPSIDYIHQRISEQDVSFAFRKGDLTTGMNVTPERREEVLFCDATYKNGIVLAVLSDSLKDFARDKEDKTDKADKAESVEKAPAFKTFDELKGKTISMITGAPFEELILSKVPEVQEFTYFTTMPDMALAIKTGKTAAGLMNNAVAELAANKDPELTVFPEPLKDTTFGIGFKKGDKRRDIWQETFDRIPSDTKEALWKKWTGSDDSVKTVPEQDWPGSNGTIEVACCDSLEPMSYMGEGGKCLGLDIETILLIAKELDVHVNFTPMDFSAVLSSLQADKADAICGSIVITDERKESMDFLEYAPAAFVFIVRTETGEEAGNTFIDRIRSSFEKTFIRENRYELFLSGIVTTLIITALSILFGTVFGFLLFMGTRRENKAANAMAGAFVWFIQGMPVVVLLMILYYIIFSKAQITGTVVAVIAFTCVFGSGVFGMLKMGVGAIDRGQSEAALSLGYGDLQSFFRIILPQAIPHFLPAYKGEVVSLVKATAIVGYIAVQDLTKMGDIVRGRTYEAFFPLVAVAVIYFILGAVLTFLVDRMEININPKRRKKEEILKGVRTDD